MNSTLLLRALAPQKTRALAILTFLLSTFLSHQALAFSLEDVEKRAKTLATTDYKPPIDRTPAALRDLDLDAYKEIRFKADNALWRGPKSAFEVMFYPTGRQFREAVQINEVTPNGSVKPLKFDPNQFDFGKNNFDAKAVEDMRLAGFRINFPLNRRDSHDELVSFLGASYFRGLGKGQWYGQSGRGLAVDVAEPRGEEFPRFTEFWLLRPTPDATAMTIYALLDSPRVTGAYRFDLNPGTTTVMNVQARLFSRDGAAKFGIAPLTSMFHFGENQPGINDYHPEIHDSDGLQLHMGNGEWIWRPLVNPKRLLVTSFSTKDPQGFGLMQRDRTFASYEDLDARYERRPSAWVEPIGKWGSGRVELVQIPTPDETNDNIVAYWTPDAMPKHQPWSFDYRLHWQLERETRPPTAWVQQTRSGRGYTRQPDGQLKFVVDFVGPSLKNLKNDSPLSAEVSLIGPGEITEKQLIRNDNNGGWRLSLLIRPTDTTKPIELRGLLRLQDQVASETWSYIVPPLPPEKS
jgi:glucans biosynthesis protein